MPQTLDQKVAAAIRRDLGWELTPSQAAEMRRAALQKLRTELRAHGFAPPVTDAGMMMLVRGAFADAAEELRTD